MAAEERGKNRNGQVVDWSLRPADGWRPQYNDVVVPLPGAILLGLLGLTAAGMKLRKTV